MYKKKKIAKRKIVLICLLVFCLILGYITNVVKTNRQLTVFEKAIKDSVLVVEKVITYPIDFVKDKIKYNKERKNLYEKYNNLLEEVEKNKIILSDNEELKHQLEEMKKLLDLKNTNLEYDMINASVISRDLTLWNDYITIDKGEEDGITTGLPVIVGDGLIGKVVNTSTFNSTIRLLSAGSDKISVKINNDETYIYGILSKYDSKNNIYTIEGISQNVDIKSGGIVTTTGMGDKFPSGIKIGTIVGVDTDNFDLSKVLKMTSSVDFNNINFVTVLKRKDIWL